MGNLRVINATIVTPTGKTARKGKEMAQLTVIHDAEVEITDGKITYAGKQRNLSDDNHGYTIDAENNVVLPGFVDSHTHLVFGGYRPEEFIWRVNGESYMSIMNRGGGIASTVNATRKAGFEELFEKTLGIVKKMAKMGVTTVEGKSGYGLDRETEIKQLEVIKALNAMPDRLVDIVPTYLGAHACPKEYKGNEGEYIEKIIREYLPEIKQNGLAENCDIFCEKDVFTVEQSRRLLSAAREMGFGLKIHADEIVCTNGAELAAELNALSADHLLQASDKGINDMAKSDTVATLLPLTAFTLRETYARGREMIDAGCAVALATDFNPGSCCSGSIPLTFALACIYMRLSVEESITAMTINGAAALGKADAIGSIEVGKEGNLVILDSDNYLNLAYFTGRNNVKTTILRGKVTATN